MKNIKARTCDDSFYLSFPTDVDLTTMTAVRVGVVRPDKTYSLRDLPAVSWNTVTAGGSLNVLVDAEDFTIAGSYEYQVYVRRLNGETVELSTSNNAYKMNVAAPIIADPWQSI